MNENAEEMMLDLLCKQAVYGLSEDEKRQLRELGGGVDSDEALSLEATVAMIAMAGVDAGEQLPDHLKVNVLNSADEYFTSIAPVRDNVARVPAGAKARTERSFQNWLGWAVAAAACVVLAVNIYLTRFDKSPEAARVLPTPPSEVRLTPAQLRQQLLDSAPDVVRADVAGLKEYQQVKGDIVWSDSKQAGYMRFRNLPANDKSKETYQLWIFDETQPEKYPIDGGTFDVDANGEVVVPINPKLRPKNPKAFAVTVEKPGGVVVSERGKIAAIGKTQA